MLCLDWENSGVDFQGSEGSSIWSYLDVVVMPCNVKLTNLGADDDRISPECSGDLQEQIKYLGPMNVLVYFNQESFKQDEYGDMRIGR